MKNLRRYGDMFGELAIKIEKDIKTKSDEELNKLEKECKSVTDTNCSWSEYGIAKTVLQYVIYEKNERKKLLRKI
ncbi:hypothetical protein [uncultured Clostridium sp.]|uniref:hypothetical protein n=1 Tax=uncultured Clostridium sp. TaxID=59620 RepID=UPI0028ECA538|nr:hypothetical protein [uncultured Clostridium sp.]